MSRHLDVQVSFTFLLQEATYSSQFITCHEGFTLCPSSIHGGYHRSSLPFYVYDLHFFGK